MVQCYHCTCATTAVSSVSGSLIDHINRYKYILRIISGFYFKYKGLLVKMCKMHCGTCSCGIGISVERKKTPKLCEYNFSLDTVVGKNELQLILDSHSLGNAGP